jgi:hypothetical protein
MAATSAQQSAQQPLRKITRAVIVGINYTGLPYALNGCINDATNMQSYLTKYHGCRNISLITDTTPVRPFRFNIIQALRTMLRAARSGETILFHYSGHGSAVSDKSGDERPSPKGLGMDSTLVPKDSMISGMITDDELRRVFTDNIKAGVTCICILDSCHSGTAVDLRYCFDMGYPIEKPFDEHTQYPVTAGQVICLSGCTDAGYSQEVYVDRGVSAGAMTWLLIEMLKSTKKSGRRISWRELLTSMRGIMSVNGISQVPQISSGQQLKITDAVFF